MLHQFAGKVWSLVRDDLGSEGDATDENYEITYSRGIVRGEYFVDAHMYGPLKPGVTALFIPVAGAAAHLQSA